MKYRKDFVTNSSSSSFVCEICGRSEGGYDMSLEDAYMYECVNGHVFCQDEAMTDFTRQEKIEMLKSYTGHDDHYYYFNWPESKAVISDTMKDTDLESVWKDCIHHNYEFMSETPEKVCPICSFKEYLDRDIIAYYKKNYHITDDEVQALTGNLKESNYIAYCALKSRRLPSDILNEIKNTYKSYEDFWRAMR